MKQAYLSHVLTYKRALINTKPALNTVPELPQAASSTKLIQRQVKD
jgi:hypothetical protein